MRGERRGAEGTDLSLLRRRVRCPLFDVTRHVGGTDESGVFSVVVGSPSRVLRFVSRARNVARRQQSCCRSIRGKCRDHIDRSALSRRTRAPRAVNATQAVISAGFIMQTHKRLIRPRSVGSPVGSIANTFRIMDISLEGFFYFSNGKRADCNCGASCARRHNPFTLVCNSAKHRNDVRKAKLSQRPPMQSELWLTDCRPFNGGLSSSPKLLSAKS